MTSPCLTPSERWWPIPTTRTRCVRQSFAAPGDVAGLSEKNSPTLELTYNWDEHAYTGGRNFGHLAYRVDNIYAYCQSLMDKGVTINRPPRDGRMAFIVSPDGISVELLQKGDALPLAEPWTSMPNSGSW